MNKKLVAAALGLAFTAPVFADASNVTLYGRLHHSLDFIQPEVGNTSSSVTNVSSRLGVRGVEDLGGGLKAIFGYEFGLVSDATGAPSTRNGYVGLDMGNAGRFAVGRLDGAISAPIYNQVFKGITHINHDGGTAQFASDINDVIRGEQRVSNAIGYSVKVGSVNLDSRLALGGTAPNRITGVPAANNPRGEQQDRTFEIAATTKIGNLDIGGGYKTFDTSAPSGIFAGGFDNRYQLVAGYQFGDFRLGGIVARNNFDGVAAGLQDDETEVGLSGSFKLSPASKIVANYFERDVVATANDEYTQYQVGYTYDFSRRTMVYVMFDSLESSNNANNERRAVITGIRHNF